MKNSKKKRKKHNYVGNKRKKERNAICKAVKI